MILASSRVVSFNDLPLDWFVFRRLMCKYIEYDMAGSAEMATLRLPKKHFG